MKAIFPAFFILYFIQIANAGLSISSYNIRNFDKKKQITNKPLLKNIISNLNTDLLGIQEVYNNDSFTSFAKAEFPGYKLALSECGGGARQNLGFMYKNSVLKLNNTVEDSRITDQNRDGCSSLRPALLGFFTVRSTGKKFVAIVLHLKAGSGSRNYKKRKKQYGSILKMIKELRENNHKNIVLMGDMNTTGWTNRDQDFRNFNYMLSRAGLKSISEKLLCTAYWNGRVRNDNIEVPSTIDHVLYTNKFLGMDMNRANVGSHCELASCGESYKDSLGLSYSSVSDHCPISASFN